MIKVKVPSTGVVLNLPPLGSSGFVFQLMRQFPKPKPPKVKVVMGGVETEDENPYSEEYQESVKAWEEMINTKTQEYTFRKIAYAQDLTADQKADVEQFRNEYGDMLDIAENNKIAWFYHFGLPDDPDELEAVVESARAQRNMFKPVDDIETFPEPHPEAVDSYRDTFQS